jgi:Arc/MetJ-type ribon-helix-helix transcriptional regulator
VAKTVTIEINQQQAQMLDRLIAEGGYGETYADVIRAGLVRFCEAHPEFLAETGGKEAP